MLRRLLRDWVAETVAWLPLPVKLALLRHCRRPLLWLLFRLETETVTVARAGAPPDRFRMWLNWQGHVDYILGTYEPAVAHALRQKLSPGRHAIDVGAHIGYHTILMSQLVGPEGSVTAFEPFPENFSTLQKNIDLNGLENVRLEPTALGQAEESIPLFFAVEQQLSWTPSQSGYSVQGKTKRVTVPAFSLDSYLRKQGTLPKLIKIDVEGAELAVLQGAHGTLQKNQPILLIEVHNWGMPDSEPVLRFLSECGYQISLLETRSREAMILCVHPASGL